ncbi:hypothetical protein NDU88_000008 [Pleurodeles waltl]|uniref:Uncharacterized protein n=1 Tax=Pleurodeles waltl TaxID=8319 RepID=A0AAV7P014_PLEWA|nr:hypothetical protein NDU88_000008 [Pleurodeles waltl]
MGSDYVTNRGVGALCERLLSLPFASYVLYYRKECPHYEWVNCLEHHQPEEIVDIFYNNELVVAGFWGTRAAPVDYRQEKQKNAKVSDWVFLGFLFL